MALARGNMVCCVRNGMTTKQPVALIIPLSNNSLYYQVYNYNQKYQEMEEGGGGGWAGVEEGRKRWASM